MVSVIAYFLLLCPVGAGVASPGMRQRADGSAKSHPRPQFPLLPGAGIAVSDAAAIASSLRLCSLFQVRVSLLSQDPPIWELGEVLGCHSGADADPTPSFPP